MTSHLFGRRITLFSLLAKRSYHRPKHGIAKSLACACSGWDRSSLHKRDIASLSKEAATQPLDFPVEQRWKAVPPANLVHLCIGGVYGYSMWTPGLTHVVGVISSAPMDWTHSEVLPVFSAAAVTLGITTATLGSWVERVGPRTSGFVGSMFWSLGLISTGAGAYYCNLPLVYMGYGVLGGIGWGLMYLSPVTTVMKWFPDKRGLATGMALSAFGVGAAIAPSIIHTLIDAFSVAPEFIGPVATTHAAPDSGNFVTLECSTDGSQVIGIDSPLGAPGQQVVVATASELSQFHDITTGPGAYVLGTGDTGVSKALATLGVAYGGLGMLGSRFMMVPHPDWNPISSSPTHRRDQPASPSEIPNSNVGLPVSDATKTNQYPLLWMSVFGNATGGLALLSSSKLMITDIWSGIAPSIVTASFTTGYVSTLGIGMAVGRFGWSAMSDYFGRQHTYATFGLGIPIVGLAPLLTHTASIPGLQESNTLPLLVAFYGGSVLAITFYGGIFSTLPAYIADLFGQQHAGAIHGKLLTAWAASAVAGPMGLAYLRSRSVDDAISMLLEQVQDKVAFQSAFGCSPDDYNTIQTLIDAKSITISRLMDVVPAETIDPTPFLYDTTCYAAAGLMGVSFLANLAIRPLDFINLSQANTELSISTNSKMQ